MQKASLIDQLLQNGQMDSDFLYYLLDIQHFIFSILLIVMEKMEKKLIQKTDLICRLCLILSMVFIH